MLRCKVTCGPSQRGRLFLRFFQDGDDGNQISMVLAETGSPRNMEAMEENFTEFSVVR